MAKSAKKKTGKLASTSKLTGNVKKPKKDEPLKVNTSFENLLNMVVNTPPKKKK